MARRPSTQSVTLYDADLAEIHVEGYGFHWEGAAASLLTWFDDYGVSKSGLVVDLGCGGGQWLNVLTKEGYKGCGIDVSESMIRIAKRNAPNADFMCGSFDEVIIPDCVAATSLGEPLNYLNSGPAIRRTMKNVFSALLPGGVFIFDVRHPPIKAVEVHHHHKAKKDWFCYARIEENHLTNRLTRHITTFRLLKGGNYRRNQEIHRLKVFSRAEMSKWLRQVGFRVQTKRGYGNYRLGPRQSVFICRKPKP